MKTNLFRTMMISAAALALTATAFGRDRLAANIPFPFRVHNNVLPAGQYTIEQTFEYGAHIFRLVNRATHETHTALAASNVIADDPSPARMVFRCEQATGCALSEIWDHTGGVKFLGPKLKPAEKERLEVVALDASER